MGKATDRYAYVYRLLLDAGLAEAEASAIAREFR